MKRAGVADTSSSKKHRWWVGPLSTFLVLVLAAVCIRLGFWQLDRQTQRDALNEAQETALSLPPLELSGDSLRAVAANPEGYLYRRVTADGVYLPEQELVIRGRALEGRPGVNFATPLVPHGDSIVIMVNRGWAPSPDAASIDPRPYAEPGSRRVIGLLLPLDAGGVTRESEVEVDGAVTTTVLRLDRDQIQDDLSLPLLPLLVQQLPDSADADPALARLPAPEMDPGPHLGYAVQWFSFAAIALIGLGIMFGLSRRRAGSS